MADPKQPRHHDGAFKRQIVQSCESGQPSREIGAEYDIAHRPRGAGSKTSATGGWRWSRTFQDKRRRYSHEGRRDTGQRRPISSRCGMLGVPAPPVTG